MLEDYLKDIYRQFGSNESEAVNNQLIQIKHDLRLIDKGQFRPNQAALTLFRIFRNMEAWQKKTGHEDAIKAQKAQDRYTLSKQVFVTSAQKIYPGTSVSLSLISSEIMGLTQQLKLVSLEVLQKEIGKLPSFETMAMEAEKNIQSAPIAEIEKLEMLMHAISDGCQKDIKNSVTAEVKTQVATCVEVLYKLQILVDKIKNTKNYKAQGTKGLLVSEKNK